LKWQKKQRIFKSSIKNSSNNEKDETVVLGTPKKLFKPFLALGKQLISSFWVLGLTIRKSTI